MKLHSQYREVPLFNDGSGSPQKRYFVVFSETVPNLECHDQFDQSSYTEIPPMN